MAYQSEAALEQQFIEQLTKQEYTTVAIPDYDALVENFKVQFEAFNAPKLDTPITDKEWERIFNLMLGKSVFQSAKILRDKFVLEREDGTKVYLSFFDQDHTKNIFQVTHQTTVVGKYVNRYDVTILVNGLPLIQVELKRRGIDIREAVNQVMRYKKHSYNGLYHFIQLFIVSNGVDTKYFANSDRDLMYSLAFFWTDFNNVRITNLKDFSISFLARDHIIKMLTRYTILNDTDKILMVMRPYQVYAVEALIRQATLFCFRILALFLIQRINHYTVCICEFTIEFFIDALNDLVQWTGTIFLTTSSFWLSRFPRSRLAFKFDCTFVCLFQTIIFQLDSIIKVKWLYGIGGKQLCQVRAENILFVQFLIEHTGNLRNVIICLPFFIHYHRLLTLRTSMCVKLL